MSVDPAIQPFPPSPNTAYATGANTTTVDQQTHTEVSGSPVLSLAAPPVVAPTVVQGVDPQQLLALLERIMADSKGLSHELWIIIYMLLGSALAAAFYILVMAVSFNNSIAHAILTGPVPWVSLSGLTLALRASLPTVVSRITGK